MNKHAVLLFLTLSLGVFPQALLAQTYLGVEFVGTSNLKINNDARTQSGPGFGILGGGRTSLFEPLALAHGFEANLKFASYNTGANREDHWNMLHLSYVLCWNLSAMALEFPVGLAVMYGPNSQHQTGKEFGVRSSLMDIGWLVPWLHVRWISLNGDSRLIMASAGLNLQF